MWQALTWVLIIQAIGLVVFPLTFRVFRPLSDRGYCFTKPIGIALIGLISWVLSSNTLLNPSKLLLFGIILSIVSISLILTFQNLGEIQAFTKKNWKSIVLLELLFLGVYAIFVAFRYWDPSINHTEQPMDFAFFNASIMSENGGPEDPWMKGVVISYYYFGYWIFAMLTVISGILPEIAYNLSMATIPALTMLTVSGLIFSMFKNENIKTVPSMIFAVTSGIATVFLSNLHGFMEFVRENAFGSSLFWKNLCIEGMSKLDLPTTQSWRPVEFWWWFKSTRIINDFGDACEGSGLDYTITEFPFFSYILGDLHPHVTSTPFFIVFLGICLCVIQQKRSRLFNSSTLVMISLLVLMLSTVTFINMWYLPSAVAILFSVYILKRIMGIDKSFMKSLIVPFTVFAISTLILSPYLLTLQTSISGLNIPSIQTKLPHALIIWLPLFIITIPHILIEFCKVQISSRWKISLATASVIAFSPWIIRLTIPSTNVNNSSDLIFFALPLTTLIALSSITATTIGLKSGITTRVIFLYLTAMGLVLILIPELWYLQDVYSNRMNTVFKLYYQAWILLSMCAGYALFHWYRIRGHFSGLSKWVYSTWTVLIIFVTAAAMYYVPASMVTKAVESPVKSLNGLLYLEKHDADLKHAIDFARKNISISDGILEGVSEWGSAGIISRSTGIPTIINWPGHQNQWRAQTDEIQKRISHVEKIYTTENVDEARTLLNLYTTKYVLVSPKEISQYGSKGMSKFNVLGQMVFGKENGTRIYKIWK